VVRARVCARKCALRAPADDDSDSTDVDPEQRASLRRSKTSPAGKSSVRTEPRSARSTAIQQSPTPARSPEEEA
jgi:hypothetical protein